MTYLYDSTNANNLPSEPDAFFAGYIDGAYRSYADIVHRFPDSVVIPIAVFATTNDGEVLDVEQGNATPVEAPGWVEHRRAANVNPVVYCNASTWPAVQQAFNDAKVEQPMYWIAQWDGVETIPAGAVAKQFKNDVAPGYDISSVSSTWPVRPQPPQPIPTGVFDVATLSLLVEGSTGPEVGALQSLLQGRGPQSPGRIDNDFGPKTFSAVEEYQKTHGLSVDGKVGNQTWTHLLTA